MAFDGGIPCGVARVNGGMPSEKDEHEQEHDGMHMEG